MRHSSSFARGMNWTSGSGIIHGFKYLSPGSHKGNINSYILINTAQLLWTPSHRQARWSRFACDYVKIKQIKL
jgi:hypothetical protein